MNGNNSSVGILVHGRHLQARGWEELVWGVPHEDKLGSLPKMVEQALMVGLSNGLTVVFGTGASEKDGLKESEYTKSYLINRIEQLKEFERIRSLIEEHGVTTDDLRVFVAGIICEVQSQNTLQEIERASSIFAANGVKTVYQITNGSHAPRCLLNMMQVKAAGGILAGQSWYVVPDDMTFGGAAVENSLAIFEAPHRGDDPMIHVSGDSQPHNYFKRLFGIKSFDDRKQILWRFGRLLRAVERAQSLSGIAIASVPICKGEWEFNKLCEKAAEAVAKGGGKGRSAMRVPILEGEFERPESVSYLESLGLQCAAIALDFFDGSSLGVEVMDERCYLRRAYLWVGRADELTAKENERLERMLSEIRQTLDRRPELMAGDFQSIGIEVGTATLALLNALRRSYPSCWFSTQFDPYRHKDPAEWRMHIPT